MKNLFGTILTILVLAGLSIGISSLISRQSSTNFLSDARPQKNTTPIDAKNLPPLPDVFSDVPVPPSSTEATETITPTPVAEEKYTLDRYYNVIPVTPGGDRKVVLITIDDGPIATSTLGPMLETFAQYNVHALFFVLGSRVSAHPELLKKIVDGGHTIGNHTWDHSNLKNISNTSIKSPLDRTCTLIEKTIGSTPHFFRPPYGSSNTYTQNYVKEKKMIFMTWSLGAEDWVKKYQSGDALAEHVISGVAPGSNILLHEHAWTRDSLDRIIVGIIDKGYTNRDQKENDIQK